MIFNTRKVVWQGILALLLMVLVGAFMFWFWTKQVAEVEEAVKAEIEGAYTLIEDVYVYGDIQSAKAGIIVYPGAKVDPMAYGTTAKQIAEKGYVVFVPQMFLNMAILSSDQASTIIDTYPQIDVWVVGGHSLGGVAAAQYIDMHPKKADGLFFWAAYPTERTDFSQTDLPMLSIYGEKDGLTEIQDIEKSKKYMSPNSIYYEIIGGNHSQFGAYGLQNKDHQADIPREKQQSEIAEAMDNWLQREVLQEARS